MKKTTQVVLVCVLLSGCVANSNRIEPLQHDVSTMEMRSEGDLKHTVIEYLSNQKSSKNCKIKTSTSESTPPARNTIDLSEQAAAHTQHFAEADRYASFIQRNAAAYFFNNDESAGVRAIALMLEWASAKAHEKVIAPPSWTSISSQRYPTYQVLGSTLMALLLLEDNGSLDPKAKSVIWNWVDELITKSYVLKELPRGTAGYMDVEQRVNNHNSTRAVLAALYAIHKNDKSIIRESNERVSKSYEYFDLNGVPYDANRGNWALNYVALAIKALALHIKIIDIVAIDPNMDDKVERINRAANFLYSETVRPVRIHKYAIKNVGRPDSKYSGVQDIWWNKDIYGDGLVHHAWTEYPFMGPTPSNLIQYEISMEKLDVIGGAVRCWSN